MRCALNEKNYHVTKTGNVTYKRPSHPFTLLRILSIFERSFLPWWQESGDLEKLDAAGVIRPNGENILEYAGEFWKLFDRLTDFMNEINKIQFHFINAGPSMGDAQPGLNDSTVGGVKSLITQLAKLANLLREWRKK